MVDFLRTTLSQPQLFYAVHGKHLKSRVGINSHSKIELNQYNINIKFLIAGID